MNERFIMITTKPDGVKPMVKQTREEVLKEVFGRLDAEGKKQVMTRIDIDIWDREKPVPPEIEAIVQ